MITGKKVLFSSLPFLLAAFFVEPVLANIDAARKAAARTEDAVNRGDYRAAIRVLSSIDCKADADCRTLIEFTTAWVYESWSDVPSEKSRERLGRALSHYQRASKADPSNTRILTNLALAARRAGDTKTAAAAISTVIKLKPEQAYENYLFLGEVLQSAGDDKRALRVYYRAVKMNPADARGHQRIIDAYRKSGSAADLYKHSLKIRHDFPNLAATGFENAIGLAYRNDADMAAKALARWTAIRADLGALSVSSLRRLPSPKDWNLSGLQQLHGTMNLAMRPPSDAEISWWKRDDVRQDAMSRLLQFKANSLITITENAKVGKNDRIQAQRIAIGYLTAAVDTGPPYQAYLGSSLAGSSNAKLDAATQLVTLHHSIKASDDPQKLSGISAKELSRMTKILFSGKGGAYAAGQLKDIQRYHTVLGMIYYETRRDKTKGADNAIFQLTHALETANKIAERNPEKYQPLPELRVLLAEVHQRQGNRKDSARESLSAAMGFLEKDNLKRADSALTSARKNGAKIEPVETILKGRQAVLAEGAGLLKTKPGSNEVALDAKISWLKNPAALKLPQSFVEGQRFKTLADLGDRVTRTTNQELASSINSLALEAASKNKILTSPTDVKRIQSLESNIKLMNIQAPVLKPIRIEGLQQPNPPAIEKSSWSLPSKQGTVQIKIDPQVLTNRNIVLDKQKLTIDKNKAPLAPQLKQ